MDNKSVAQALREVAAVFSLQDKEAFRSIAYLRAADSIEHLTEDVKELWEEGKLKEIPSVGANISAHLDEFFRKGKVKHFEEVKKGFPKAMFSLMKIPGFGAKKAYKIAKLLKIKDSDNPYEVLEEACLKNKIAGFSGFGKKSEEEIFDSLKRFQKRETQKARMLLYEADSVADRLIAYLKQSPLILEAFPLGSLRRRVATVGDIDIAVSSKNSLSTINYFLKYPKIQKVIEKGDVGASVLVEKDIQVDLMVKPPWVFGSLLQHFTGSKHHNIKLREYALKKNYSLSENGIKIKKKGRSFLKQFASEKEFYRFLNMPLIPPELREDTGEIEKALENKLPRLVTRNDLKGDLHLHSNYNLKPSHDLGVNTFSEIIKKAESLNYQYICFSEHNPKISGHKTSDIISILKARKNSIDKLIYSTKFTRVKIFNMLEVDIKPNGDIAIPKEAFEYIDAAIISVHSSFDQNRLEMTKRILKALSFPKVKILGHPTGRLINKREAIDADWEKIFAFCRQKKIALEINANPLRLDLPDLLVRTAVNNGNKMVISTDSHDIFNMDFIGYGVSVARRGWATKNDILNTLDYNSFRKWLLN